MTTDNGRASIREVHDLLGSVRRDMSTGFERIHRRLDGLARDTVANDLRQQDVQTSLKRLWGFYGAWVGASLVGTVALVLRAYEI